MRKKYLLALVFGLMLSFSGYAQSESTAQSESKGSFFLSAGVNNGLFPNGPIFPINNFEIKKLFAAMVSGNYEFPTGAGNTVFGLEAGYSSGSRFGGKGGVDFLPFGFNVAYVYPLASFFYVGPRVKIGGLGLLGSDWNDVVLTVGARLEAELRSKSFPFGLFVAGGIDAFPFAPEFATLPVVEAGLRYPRGKFTWSSSSGTAKNKESAGTITGGSKDTGQSAQVAAVGTGAPATGQGATVGSGTAAAGTGATTSQTPGAASAVVGSGTAGTAIGTGTGTTTGAGTGTIGSGAPATTPSAGTGAAAVSSGAGPTAGAGAVATPSQSATAGTGGAIPGVPQGQNRSITLEDGRQGILNSIYFEPDNNVLIETYRPILDSVGRQLAADSGLKLLIRAYAADFGTAEGRYAVSSSRARFSRDYLTSQYGISANRFSSEAYGADKSPIYATSDWQTHRCVELILVR